MHMRSRCLIRTVSRANAATALALCISQGKAKMVNPAKLVPPLRDAVCAQCHLTGQSRVARSGHRIEDYRPGDALSDFVAFLRAGESRTASR